MEKLISDAYYIGQTLRKLQNDVGHEADIDHGNLRRAMKHFADFYQELVQAALEKQREANLDAAKAALESAEGDEAVDIE